MTARSLIGFGAGIAVGVSVSLATAAWALDFSTLEECDAEWNRLYAMTENYTEFCRVEIEDADSENPNDRPYASVVCDFE